MGMEKSFSTPVQSSKGIAMSEPKSATFSDNAAGAIAYITVFPAIAFLILVPYKKSPFVRFHAWQSIFLNFFLYVVSYLLSIVLPMCRLNSLLAYVSVNWFLAIFWLVVWIFFSVSALRGKSYKMPILGRLAQRQAAG
jgi:uncharacterized membrane protein